MLAPNEFKKDLRNKRGKEMLKNKTLQTVMLMMKPSAHKIRIQEQFKASSETIAKLS
jgi:hypothetical protein